MEWNGFSIVITNLSAMARNSAGFDKDWSKNEVKVPNWLNHFTTCKSQIEHSM